MISQDVIDIAVTISPTPNQASEKTTPYTQHY
jgi:hypothetical protein